MPACAVAAATVLTAPAPAHAFTGGHHETITRSALPWEPRTLTEMADARRGAVNANDHGDYFRLGILHCDNADYLTPRHAAGYPRTRDEATTELLACIRSSVTRFRAAVRASDGLVDAEGRVSARDTDLGTPCPWNERPGRAKCHVLEQLGRGWHQIQDFYSHSNWSDRTTGTLGVTNPPGLARTSIAPFLAVGRYSTMADADWTKEAAALVPEDLSTGCYPDFDSTGVRPVGCDGRVRHNGTLAKDTPAARRSGNGNFHRATGLAAQDTARQWEDFQAALRAAYPGRRGEQMICALVHDRPAAVCP
ncbi:CinY protein [Streptomyces sp. NPDC007369]|uniref:CinY protein n=1 Tax=Streptomyces sp. NPDC007369 TaxID=3154589 RepID=UPI0033D048C7